MASVSRSAYHDQVTDLAQSLLDRAASLGEGRRLFCAIVGIPGSGKTTLAKRIADRTNELAGTEVLVEVGLDGW